MSIHETIPNGPSTRDVLRNFTVTALLNACTSIPIPNVAKRRKARLLDFISSLDSTVQTEVIDSVLQMARNQTGRFSKKRKLGENRAQGIRRRDGICDGVASGVDVSLTSPIDGVLAGDDSYNLPGTQFLQVVSPSVVNSSIAGYLERTSNEALRSASCICCSRWIRKSLLHVVSFEEIPNRYLMKPVVDHPAHKLYEGLLIEPRGLLELHDRRDALICRECYRHLRCNSLPPLSLANDMWVGEVPMVLGILSLVEKLLVARYFSAAYVIKLYPQSRKARGMDRDGLHSAMRGNVASHPLSSNAVAEMVEGNLLPHNVEILASLVSVAFVNSKLRRARGFPGILHVRRQRVLDALLWLRSNNPMYFNIEISERNIDLLPENGVPEVVMDTAMYAVQNSQGDEDSDWDEFEGKVWFLVK